MNQDTHTQQTERQVQDEGGRIHYITKEIASGGQGSVWKTQNSKIVVKLLSSSSQDKRERLRAQLKYVTRLPLEKLPIAKPISTLKAPHLGYVMELASGMEPILKLLVRPESPEEITKWYIATGGLRRRLVLLYKIVEVLNILHSKGLVYSDISPNNIFISSNPDYHEIFFIDADNIHANSLQIDKLYTQGYGAPELFSDKSSFVNTLTDIWSFAVLAFQILTLEHPFIGDYVNNGAPDLEEQAFRGDLPWIDHSTEKINSSMNGFPREFVLSEGIKTLFRKVFEEELYNPGKRPRMAEWQETIGNSLHSLIECPTCKSTYFAKHSSCPWCNSPRPEFVYVEIGRWLSLFRIKEEDWVRMKKNLEKSVHANSIDITLVTNVLHTFIGESFENQSLFRNQLVQLLGTETVQKCESSIFPCCNEFRETVDYWRNSIIVSYVIEKDISKEISHKIAFGSKHENYSKPVCILTFEKGNLTIQKCEEEALFLTFAEEQKKITQKTVIPLNSDQWLLHFGLPNQPHRVARFQKIPGGKVS